jgi:hypothetical protein
MRLAISVEYINKGRFFSMNLALIVMFLRDIYFELVPAIFFRNIVFEIVSSLFEMSDIEYFFQMLLPHN